MPGSSVRSPPLPVPSAHCRECDGSYSAWFAVLGAGWTTVGPERERRFGQIPPIGAVRLSRFQARRRVSPIRTPYVSGSSFNSRTPSPA